MPGLRRLVAAAAATVLGSGPFAPLLYIVPHVWARSLAAVAEFRSRRRRRRATCG